jgi:hypothetical protein
LLKAASTSCCADGEDQSRHAAASLFTEFARRSETRHCPATDEPMNPLYFDDNLFVLREHIARASVE